MMAAFCLIVAEVLDFDSLGGGTARVGFNTTISSVGIPVKTKLFIIVKCHGQKLEQISLNTQIIIDNYIVWRFLTHKIAQTKYILYILINYINKI